MPTPLLRIPPLKHSCESVGIECTGYRSRATAFARHTRQMQAPPHNDRAKSSMSQHRLNVPRVIVGARDDAVIGEMDTGKVDACAEGIIPTSGERPRGAALLRGLTTKDVRDML